MASYDARKGRVMGADSIVIDGLAFEVLARFSGDNRQAQANAYMSLHSGTRVLCERHGALILAASNDKGVLVQVDDFLTSASWFNLRDVGVSR